MPTYFNIIVIKHWRQECYLYEQRHFAAKNCLQLYCNIILHTDSDTKLRFYETDIKYKGFLIHERGSIQDHP